MEFDDEIEERASYAGKIDLDAARKTVRDLLRRAGGDNVFDDASERYPEITIEALAAKQPELILLPDEPYPIMLVRPEGIAAYYAARAALDSWGSDFGYELVGSDWELKYPQPDPQLAALTRKVVDETRLRHREYVLSSPQVA